MCSIWGIFFFVLILDSKVNKNFVKIICRATSKNCFVEYKAQGVDKPARPGDLISAIVISSLYVDITILYEIQDSS